MIQNLGRNALLVELVFLTTAGIGQPRRVEDANLGKRLPILITFTNVGTYRDAIVAREFVKAGRVGLALVVRSLIGMVEYAEVVIINVISNEDIGDEFYD